LLGQGFRESATAAGVDDYDLSQLVERLLKPNAVRCNVFSKFAEHIAPNSKRNERNENFAVCSAPIVSAYTTTIHVNLDLVEQLFIGIFRAVVKQDIIRFCRHIGREEQEETFASPQFVNFIVVYPEVKSAVIIMLGNFETGYPLEQGYVLEVNFGPVFCKSTAQPA
jgi:hypothetical protein